MHNSQRRLFLFAALGAAAAATACGTPAPQAAIRSPNYSPERLAALDAAVPAPNPELWRSELLQWPDATRKREVLAKLYLPQGAALPTGPMPLVVVSHGIGGSREGYSYLGKYWAANGIAALHLQHVGSDRAVWFGNPVQMVTRLQTAAQETEAIDRAKDASFALTQLLARTELRIDPARVAVAGHSYGANTAMLLAGARVPREDGVLSLRDERISAAMLMSAPPFYREPLAERIVAAIAVPTLHVTATADDIQIPGYGSGVKDRLAIYQAMGSPRKALAVFQGGSHSVFTDRLGTGGIDANPKIKRATRELGLAFWQEVFGAQTGRVAAWQNAHTSLLARFEQV